MFAVEKPAPISYTMLSDKELLQAMKNNDERALLSLHKRYGKAMFITANKRINSPEDAEEIVMDIFHNLWRIRKNFQLQHENMRGYFTKAVVNHVFRFIRRKATYEEQQTEHAKDYVYESSTTPEHELIVKELRQKVEQAIKLLPLQCKIVFQMHHDDNLSRKEIAKRLNISENTVKYHLKKANTEIKGNLKIVAALLLELLLHYLMRNRKKTLDFITVFKD